MRTFVESRWYGHAGILNLFKPLSYVTAWLTRRRRLERHSPPTHWPSVVVVGNISVGGTGKTPLVIALIEALTARGYRPGVVSRGYGRKHTGLQKSWATGSAKYLGDEASLIAHRTGVPVAVCEARVEALEALVSETACDVVLSDDGMQHYRLPRDIEIAVIDGRRGFGNGQLLPVGPLREPPERLADCDFVVVNGEGAQLPDPVTQHPAYYRTVLTPLAISPLNPSAEEGSMVLACTDVAGELSRVHAVAGIGDPTRFFRSLQSLGLDIVPHPFPDHHEFKATDFQFAEPLPVVMTAKDAIKCREFSLPDAWVLEVEMALPADFLGAFVAKLKPPKLLRPS